MVIVARKREVFDINRHPGGCEKMCLGWVWYPHAFFGEFVFRQPGDARGNIGVFWYYTCALIFYLSIFVMFD